MLRYYPSFRILTNLNTKGNEFTLNGANYIGKYYETYNKKTFSGSSPKVGPSLPLQRVNDFASTPGLKYANLPNQLKNKLAVQTNIKSVTRTPGKPNSYFPKPTEQDYTKGYIIRCFTKKENEQGYITEIAKSEHDEIKSGTVDYDVSIYQTIEILWKITGPLRSTRQSQYNIIPGIIDTNQRLVEEANKTFVGIIDFIDSNYIKFAKTTL